MRPRMPVVPAPNHWNSLSDRAPPIARAKRFMRPNREAMRPARETDSSYLVSRYTARMLFMVTSTPKQAAYWMNRIQALYWKKPSWNDFLDDRRSIVPLCSSSLKLPFGESSEKKYMQMPVPHVKTPGTMKERRQACSSSKPVRNMFHTPTMSS